MTRRLVVIGAISVVAFGAAAAFGSADRSTVGVSWHPQQESLGNEGPVDNASATLSRNANEISYRLETNSLTASSAHTPWVVVVNNPAACDPSPCTAPDIIQNPATDSQVLFGTGFVASGSGKATFVLGPRHFGVVYVPEFVGASGGDLPAIESSPLVLGVRQLDGVVFVPGFVGASGGDLPSVESSPLVFGPRHTAGVVYLPVYVGHADGVFPENTR